MRLLIKNGRIWDGERFFYADVLTEDQTIAAIRPDIQEKATYCFDATGMTVSAGLLDMHAHFRGISADIYGIAADAACLPFGVTTAVDVSAMKGNKDMLGLLGVKVPVMAFIGIKEDKAVFTAAERAFENYGDRVPAKALSASSFPWISAVTSHAKRSFALFMSPAQISSISATGKNVNNNINLRTSWSTTFRQYWKKS